MSSSDFPSNSGTSSDSFNDNFNKTANTANTIATGVIVAIVVCCVLGIVSLGVFIWWFRRHTKRRREREAALDASLYGPPGPGPGSGSKYPPQQQQQQPPPQQNGTTYPPRSPSLSPAAPEMATPGHTSRWEAPGQNNYYQQQQQQYSGVSNTSASTAVESDGHPRYEMDGTGGMSGPGTGNDPNKGDRYV